MSRKSKQKRFNRANYDIRKCSAFPSSPAPAADQPVLQAEAKASNNSTVFLDSAILERDFSYQRPVRMTKVNKIVSGFNPDVVNALKVSLRDGHYYVFDGSHTLEALKKINGKESFPVECKLFTGLTYEREAELFALQNGEATRVSVTYKIRALAASHDAETTGFIEATREGGFEMTPGRTTAKPGYIIAVAKAQELYKAIGREAYVTMLQLIKEAWNGESWSVSQYMLGGMGIFIKTFGTKINAKRFVKKLRCVSCPEIQKEASKFQNVPAAHKYACAIVRFYNKSGGNGTLLISELNAALTE